MKKTLERVSRLTVILILALVILVPQAVVFAAEATQTTSTKISGGSIELVESFPASGDKGLPIENVGIKLFFSDDVTADNVWKANKDCFKLTDKKGKKVPVSAYHGDADNKYILVIAEPKPAKKNQSGKLNAKSKYTLTISNELMSSDGGKLAKDLELKFTTLDVQGNTRISMYLMLAMLVGIVGIMFINNTRKLKAQQEAKILEKANPYKIAKEKGITVDAAKAQIEHAREKNQKKLDKLGPGFTDLLKAPEADAAKEIEQKKKSHKVNGPKPITAAGGKYKTGKKAIAEKKEAAAKKAAAAKAKAKSGNGKKGKKK